MYTRSMETIDRPPRQNRIEEIKIFLIRFFPDPPVLAKKKSLDAPKRVKGTKAQKKSLYKKVHNINIFIKNLPQ